MDSDHDMQEWPHHFNLRFDRSFPRIRRRKIRSGCLQDLSPHFHFYLKPSQGVNKLVRALRMMKETSVHCELALVYGSYHTMKAKVFGKRQERYLVKSMGYRIRTISY
ncbi:hypothetical protein OUZ56_004412 [Daphnia magna]|uniref:Uncharacterized protein n=1 Tax=Daphnia magna TaxID=35525 RepID=A0ABQ9YPP5_9CRUS|nr:hypothetical protein OUZ56_004412 [Daphnia magna]